MTKKTNAADTAKINEANAEDAALLFAPDSHAANLAIAWQAQQHRTEGAIEKSSAILLKPTKTSPGWSDMIEQLIELGGILFVINENAKKLKEGKRTFQTAAKNMVAATTDIPLTSAGAWMSHVRAMFINKDAVMAAVTSGALNPVLHTKPSGIMNVVRENMPKPDKAPKARNTKGNSKTVSKGTHNVSATVRKALADATTVNELILALRAECQASGVNPALVDGALRDTTTV
jgi:adenosylcobinamide amidohydrolase